MSKPNLSEEELLSSLDDLDEACPPDLRQRLDVLAREVRQFNEERFGAGRLVPSTKASREVRRAMTEDNMGDLPEITGSAAMTAAAATSVPPSDGQSFVLTARQLWEGAQILAESKVSTPLPGALLAAQALESALKALLWTTGRVLSELKKRPLEHDLEALWTATAKSGFPVATLPPDWCVCLNTLHARPFHGRYPSGLDGLMTPNAKQSLLEIGHVLSLADYAVKAAPWRKPGA